jgi:hypothetical protein
VGRSGRAGGNGRRRWLHDGECAVTGHGGAHEAMRSLREAEAKRKPTLARRERAQGLRPCTPTNGGHDGQRRRNAQIGLYLGSIEGASGCAR